ncbi:141aa long hypothetical protein [Pyrococcus horikoshii OT3]|uniref:Uncharacterized protein n=1 Tax=Pyrococcus horikoshii (strain ATCC 700860 / DSM 12428 / JCM 9974 / NBRC 100139 / OT-3) TaxID=70601 RepID=O58147_PYRHO|nr:141aa long hypothetical protein [Pyrococcus horikoshii OT3]
MRESRGLSDFLRTQIPRLQLDDFIEQLSSECKKPDGKEVNSLSNHASQAREGALTAFYTSRSFLAPNPPRTKEEYNHLELLSTSFKSFSTNSDPSSSLKNALVSERYFMISPRILCPILLLSFRFLLTLLLFYPRPSAWTA